MSNDIKCLWICIAVLGLTCFGLGILSDIRESRTAARITALEHLVMQETTQSAAAEVPMMFTGLGDAVPEYLIDFTATTQPATRECNGVLCSCSRCAPARQRRDQELRRSVETDVADHIYRAMGSPRFCFRCGAERTIHVAHPGYANTSSSTYACGARFDMFDDGGPGVSIVPIPCAPPATQQADGGGK